MGGGGDNKVEETAQQKALAEVSIDRWQDYAEKYRPFENAYMGEVNRMNSDRQYRQAANMAAVPVENNFTQAVMQSGRNMVTAGINPNSGLFKSEIEKLDRNKAALKSDMTNQAQMGQQGRYLGGLKNVVAMGQGQATESVQGMSDISSASAQKAYNSANNSMQRSNDNQRAVGAVVGAGTSYGLKQIESGSGE